MKSKTVKCSICGNDVLKNTKHCIHCGAKIKKSVFKKPWFWIVIILVPIIAAVSGGDNSTGIDTSISTDNFNEMIVDDNINSDLDTNTDFSTSPSSEEEVTNNPGSIDTISSDTTEIPKETETEPIQTEPVETEPVETTPNLTLGQINALLSAESYLAFTPFSYEGLISQLEYEDYSHDEAVFAADNCGADWNKQALKSAKIYLDFSAFSYEGLIDQLEYEKYTSSEAKYAADNCGADWKKEALESAKNYLDFSAFSYKGLINQLEYEKYTGVEAKYAADNCGADWMEQAVKCAKSYLDFTTFSRNELIEQLEYEGFTHDEAVYGVEQNGY